MKKIVAFSVLAVLCAAVSCKKADTSVLVQAIVTVKDNVSNSPSFYLQLDDSTAVVPTNRESNPFGKQVRAHTYYYDKGSMDTPAGSSTKYWRQGEIQTIDSIRTKKAVSAAEGDAPVEIYRSWMNGIEDGYLTLVFQGLWGQTGKVHQMNLVKNFSADSLCYNLVHNACGDTTGLACVASGIIAFDISDMPVPASAAEYDVFVKYTGYTKDKVLRFHNKKGVWAGPYNDVVLSEEQAAAGKYN